MTDAVSGQYPRTKTTEFSRAAMKAVLVPLWFFLLAASAVAEPWMGHLLIQDNQVWQGGRPGNYGTVHYFLDEEKGDTIPVEVFVEVYADGKPADALQVELFTNLNRRDHAKVWESPGDAGRPNSYYMTYRMNHVGRSENNERYKASLSINRAGVYRLTARFKVGEGPWRWHNDFAYDGTPQRDCAVVVSPKKVLDLTIYEVNPLVVEASTGNSSNQRSTLEDFTDHDRDGFDPFNLGTVRQAMGFNTLWLMPIFPKTQERWDPKKKSWVPNHSPGSPYAARDYWSVSEQLSEAKSQSASMTEFQYLVSKAEDLNLNVFLDMALNHAGADAIYGQGAVDLGLAKPPEKQKRIRQARAAWGTSRSDYRRHAGSGADIAVVAPADRLGEHQWYDAGLDWFFGDYSSLGPKPDWGDTSRGGALDERDLFYTDLDPASGHDFEVENVWNYFAHLLPYWLSKTNNRLDGIRADFAQGVPPHAWEYIINKTRQKKWDFIFLAEALDPDQVRYRVNRSFDLLTTVDHWLYRNSTVSMSQLAGSLEREAELYGYNAAILHNGTSHDEEGNGNVWLMVARYAVAAAIHGVPMAYMGQPLGVAQKIDFEKSWQHLAPYWKKADGQVFTMYKRINSARAENPALRLTNRYFLNRRDDGGFNEDVFSVARWAADNIVLAFVNLRDYLVAPDVFAVPATVPLDRSAGVRYQAYNVLADDPGAALWSEPRTAEEIYAGGVYVKFNFPNEAQYLRLQRVQ
jgi:glycosidase